LKKAIIVIIIIILSCLLCKEKVIAEDTGNYQIAVDSNILLNEAKISDQIREIEKNSEFRAKQIDKEIVELRLLLVGTKALSETNEQAIENYLTTVALLTGSVIGLVALFLGIGVIKIYFDHQRMKEKINDQFKTWRQKMEADMEAKCTSMLIDIEKNLYDYSYFLKLKMLIAQGEVDVGEVYPLITPLCENPINAYKPIFEKIINKNIDDEVTAKVRKGLKKISP